MKPSQGLASIFFLVAVTPGDSLNYNVSYWENLWPRGIVYYQMTLPNVGWRRQRLFCNLMRYITQLEALTCIRFVRRRWNTKRSLFLVDMSYQEYGPTNYGDYPYLFWVANYYERVAPGILAALGLDFEMRRKDRDKYIKIDFEKMHPWNSYLYSKTYLWPPHDVIYPPYSLHSEMHSKIFDQYSEVVSLRCPEKLTDDTNKPDIRYDADRVNAVYDLLSRNITRHVNEYDHDSHAWRYREIILRPATPVCKLHGFIMEGEDLSC